MDDGVSDLVRRGEGRASEAQRVAAIELRCARLSEAISMSQDGGAIRDMEQRLAEAQAELKAIESGEAWYTDQSTPPISHLFATVATWAMEQGMPPRSFWEGQTEDWTVRINATTHMLEGVEPYHIHLEHRCYLAFAVLNAGGGALTGPSEDEVIAHFNGLLKDPVEAA